MVGANSPSSLASRPIRILLADEIDRYPATAGNEGDPLLLAGKRLATFWNKKEVCVSTPTIKETSRIEELFAFIVTTVLPQIAQAFVEWGPQIISVIQGIYQIFQTVASAVISVIQFLMPTIQSLIGTGLETVRSVVSGVLTAIQGLLSVFSGIFTGNWTQIWTGAQNIFSGIWQSISGIARGALNGIIDIINGLIGGLNKLKIPDWVPGVGGKGINIPLIPKFAKGTPRTPDTFIAGERGAELITNARNRTVFKSAETGNIFTNLASMAKTLNGKETKFNCASQIYLEKFFRI